MNFSSNSLKEVIEILKTAPGQRTEAQVKNLQEETKEIGLFKSQKEEDANGDVHRLCCLYMRHESFQKDETVFKIDEVGYKFYIILSGRVGIHIRMKKHRKNSSHIPHEKINHEEPLTMVKELYAGDSFGELALLSNQKRLASVTCTEDCQFGVLEKKIFRVALKEIEEEKVNIRMRFLAASPLFSRMPKRIIKTLHMNAFYVPFSKNQPVFLEGELPNACYIIKSGEFTVSKDYHKRDAIWFATFLICVVFMHYLGFCQFAQLLFQVEGDTLNLSPQI